MGKALPTVLIAAWLGTGFAGAPAAELNPVLGTNELLHLTRSLSHLNMTRADLGFTKDVGKPRLALERVRKMLGDPLELPRMADELLQAVQPQDDPAPLWLWTARALELKDPGLKSATAAAELVLPPGELSAPLAAALKSFYAEAARASALLQSALAALTADQKKYLAASFLAETFNAEDDPAARRALLGSGVSESLLDQVIKESQALDPEPATTRCLDLVERINLAELLAAGQAAQGALQTLSRNAADNTAWPAKPLRVATPLGAIWIGTTNADVYAEPALLILDPGGNDAYADRAGAADGTRGQPLALVLDVSGDDRYRSTDICGAGAALFGVCGLLDLAGRDVYQAAYLGQGAGVFGVAWHEDRGGSDTYQARAIGQAAGYVGAGFLHDVEGDDLYDIGFYGQGFSGVRGVGVLLDRAGNDRYVAGRILPDHERHDDRYLSLAQGFSIGLRPFAGGGIAALVDLAGNDAYEADVFGQGVGYWYSVGMLLDRQGHDTYRAYHYGQGAGIHLSLGLLADGAGNDVYSGDILCQGHGHDYAVGMLLDQAGNDTYTTDQYSQGQGIYNSVGILLDSSGDDAYFARQSDTAQGIGQDGDTREYGSLGLLLDLAGKDTYSCGARDRSRLVRPNFGIVYDNP